MEPTVGEVLEGKVTGITKFGAFVKLDSGSSGLVHISELSNSFVSDVHDIVEIGQTVKVRVIKVGEDGRLNLSVKRAAEAPAASPQFKPKNRTYVQAPPVQADAGADFEDRLKKFMQESDSRMADNRMYADRRQRSRRR